MNVCDTCKYYSKQGTENKNMAQLVKYFAILQRKKMSSWTIQNRLIITKYKFFNV